MRLPDRVSYALNNFRRALARPLTLPAVGDLDGWRTAVSAQSDALGLGIDPPIQELIALLNAHGLETRGSCAGHPRGERGDRTALPYVDFIRRDDLLRMHSFLDELAADGVDVSGLVATVPEPGSTTHVFRLEAVVEAAVAGDAEVDANGNRIMSVWHMWVWGDEHVRAADLTDTQRASLRERAAAFEQLAAASLVDLRAQMDALAGRLEHDLTQGHLLSGRDVGARHEVRTGHEIA